MPMSGYSQEAEDRYLADKAAQAEAKARRVAREEFEAQNCPHCEGSRKVLLGEEKIPSDVHCDHRGSFLAVGGRHAEQARLEWLAAHASRTPS